MSAFALPAHPAARPYLLAFGLLLLALWAFSHSYITRDSQACLALYRAARTQADTALVDRTMPGADRMPPESHSCGFTRQAARWP